MLIIYLYVCSSRVAEDFDELDEGDEDEDGDDGEKDAEIDEDLFAGELLEDD